MSQNTYRHRDLGLFNFFTNRAMEVKLETEGGEVGGWGEGVGGASEAQRE